MNRLSNAALSNEVIFRAWRDREYLEKLDPEMRAKLPKNPSGGIELADIRPLVIVDEFSENQASSYECGTGDCGTMYCTETPDMDTSC